MEAKGFQSASAAAGASSQPVKAVACSIVRSQSLGVGDYRSSPLASPLSPSSTRRPTRGSLKLKRVQPVVDPRSGKTATPTARFELHVPGKESPNPASPNPTSPPRVSPAPLSSRRCNSVGSVADGGRSPAPIPVQPQASNIARSSSDVGPRGIYCPQIRRVRLEDLSPSPTPQGPGMDARSRALSHDDMLYLSGLSAVRRCESPGPGTRMFKRTSAGPRARPESPSTVTLYMPNSPSTPSNSSSSTSYVWSPGSYNGSSSSSPTRMLLREIDDICDELDQINVISQNINTLASDEDSFSWMEGRKPGDVKYLPGTPAQSPKQRWFYVKPPEGATVVKPISFRTSVPEPPVKATIPNTDPTYWELPTRGPSAFKSGHF